MSNKQGTKRSSMMRLIKKTFSKDSGVDGDGDDCNRRNDRYTTIVDLDASYTTSAAEDGESMEISEDAIATATMVARGDRSMTRSVSFGSRSARRGKKEKEKQRNDGGGGKSKKKKFRGFKFSRDINTSSDVAGAAAAAEAAAAALNGDAHAGGGSKPSLFPDDPNLTASTMVSSDDNDGVELIGGTALPAPFDPNVSAIAPVTSFEDAPPAATAINAQDDGDRPLSRRRSSDAMENRSVSTNWHRSETGTVMAVRLALVDANDDSDEQQLDKFGHPAKLSTKLDRSSDGGGGAVGHRRVPSTIERVCRYAAVDASDETPPTGPAAARAAVGTATTASGAAKPVVRTCDDGGDTVRGDDPTAKSSLLATTATDTFDDDELTLSRGTYDEDEYLAFSHGKSSGGTYDDDELTLTHQGWDGRQQQQQHRRDSPRSSRGRGGYRSFDDEEETRVTADGRHGPPLLKESSDISTLSDDTGAYLDDDDAFKGKKDGRKELTSPDREWSRTSPGKLKGDKMATGNDGRAVGATRDGRQRRSGGGDRRRVAFSSPPPSRSRGGVVHAGAHNGTNSLMLDDSTSVASESSIVHLLRYCHCLPHPKEEGGEEDDTLTLTHDEHRDDVTLTQRKVGIEGMDLVVGERRTAKETDEEGKEVEHAGSRGDAKRKLGLMEVMFSMCGAGRQ